MLKGKCKQSVKSIYTFYVLNIKSCSDIIESSLALKLLPKVPNAVNIFSR